MCKTKKSFPLELTATPAAKLRPWAPFHLYGVKPPLYGMLRATSRLLLQAAAAALKAVAQEGGSGKQGWEVGHCRKASATEEEEEE